MHSLVVLALLSGLGLATIACDPLGDHYEEKASLEGKERARREAKELRKAAPKKMLRATECEQCHPAIYQEWTSSMHAKSTAEADPLYALVLEKAATSLSKRQANQQCRKCHYAEWSQREETRGAKPSGVTCTVCHEIAAGHPTAKLAGGEVARLAGGPVSSGKASGTQELCLSCHGGLELNGQPLCVTDMGSDSKQGKCTDCHMGVADGPAVASRTDQTSHRAHDFAGGHNARFLRGAARISLAREGEQIVVTVKHGRAGHTVPTGHPMRHLVAVVEQFDASGERVATNAGSDDSPPLGKTPVFMQIFSSEAGERPVQPFRAAGKPIDTRLRPGDVKAMRIAIAPGAKTVKATLQYHLAPRDILKAAGLPTEPAVMSSAELAL